MGLVDNKQEGKHYRVRTEEESLPVQGAGRDEVKGEARSEADKKRERGKEARGDRRKQEGILDDNREVRKCTERNVCTG